MGIQGESLRIQGERASRAEQQGQGELRKGLAEKRGESGFLLLLFNPKSWMQRFAGSVGSRERFGIQGEGLRIHGEREGGGS
jgi:hypothetical protein